MAISSLRKKTALFYKRWNVWFHICQLYKDFFGVKWMTGLLDLRRCWFILPDLVKYFELNILHLRSWIASFTCHCSESGIDVITELNLVGLLAVLIRAQTLCQRNSDEWWNQWTKKCSPHIIAIPTLIFASSTVNRDRWFLCGLCIIWVTKTKIKYWNIKNLLRHLTKQSNQQGSGTIWDQVTLWRPVADCSGQVLFGWA